MDEAKVFLREKKQYVTVPINPEFAECIDDLVLEKWQKMINLVASILGVKAGLIMRITRDNMEVFLRSDNEENPYPFDGKDQLGHGLYCETVIGENRELYIDNSLYSKAWQDNPDVELEMFSYYGLPIKNPDGTFFGTICALDNKTMVNSDKYRGLLDQFRSSIESDLKICQMNEELERRVKERTTQLETSNKELETFAYSISHDLRSPLRAMSGFSEVLLQEYGSSLDEKGIHYLGRIVKAAGQMGRLIDDLLQVAKVARSELDYRQVNLSEIAQDILSNLTQDNPERNVKYKIEEGLLVEGDHELSRVLMENLLSNAWKFTAGKDEAVIELGQVTVDKDRVFYVRDNGIGFETKYVGKVFGLFQRLHGSGEYPGTGIGLAITQKIVSRHGGRIWAESEVGKGATFYFTFNE